MSTRTFVYLIEACSGEIKIGCSAVPARRVAAICMSSPCEVRLIAQWPGAYRDERELHRQYSEFRVYREWFLNHGALAEFVAVRRGDGVQAIADWGGVYSGEAAARKADKSRRLSEAHKANWADPAFRELQREFRGRGSPFPRQHGEAA